MIDDAPWIREAERYGEEEPPTIYCPVCGAEEPEEFYTDETGIDVLGCSYCIKRYDPYEWTTAHN